MYVYLCHPIHEPQMSRSKARHEEIGLLVDYDDRLPIDQGFLINTVTGLVRSFERVKQDLTRSMPSSN